MDFQAFVDRVGMACAVLSVERTPEGGCGEIRILKANQCYKDTMGPAYYDGMPYYELVPQDSKFEDFCFRAAIAGQKMHWYVETKAMDCWTDATVIPMAPENENLGYCQFLFEFTKRAEAERMASVSVDTAEAVIKACITLLGAQDFRKSVGDVLEDILRLSNAFCCRILLIDHGRRESVTFCERFRADFSPDMFQGDGDIPYALARTWEDMIGVSNGVIIKNEQDMQALESKNPDWGRSLRAYRVESLILMPLRQGKKVIGYLYIVNFDIEKVVALKELVELVSFFLGTEISNHLLLNQLEEMSRTDALTGLNNRNAMIQRMRALSIASPAFGIINMDLNGLKTVNDTQGHDAGDRLLVQAAEILRKVFYQEDIYRTGGDEFIVIAANISRESFERKVARLKGDVLKNSEVSFAIGAFWTDGDVDMTAAFRQADQRMYRDKQTFYAQNPNCRQKRPGFFPTTAERID